MNTITFSAHRLRLAGTLPSIRTLSTVPPTSRRPYPAVPAATPTGSTSRQPASRPASVEEDLDKDRPTFTQAIRLMNGSSALLAIQAFTIATGVVMLGGFGAVWALKSVLGFHDTRELAQHIRGTLLSTPSSLAPHVPHVPESPKDSIPNAT